MTRVLLWLVCYLRAELNIIVTVHGILPSIAITYIGERMGRKCRQVRIVRRYGIGDVFPILL